jgi:hypothetical protein
MGNELAVFEDGRDLQIARPPEIVLEEAKRAAKALADVVSKKKKPVIMNGEQYLEFEDWQTVGRFYGVTAKVVDTHFIDYGNAQGFEAKAVAIRADGMEISGAEAMCLNDENNWKNKPMFQLRSMAQTRACAKALRNVLAWVVVLAGYKPTPAEEMQGVFDEKKPPIQQPQAKSASPPDSNVRLSLKQELANYCNGNAKEMEKLVKELSCFESKNDGKKIVHELSLESLDNPKVSDKWLGTTLGKLRKLTESKCPEGCTKNPQTCEVSEYIKQEGSEDLIAQCQGKPCQFQGK